jgi:hypothetical protein
MTSLSKNWITEKLIDFEYKKYLLLAYLQQVSGQFDETRLYPSLSELIEHYKNVVSLRENKKSLYDSFPERMSNADFTSFKIIYEKILEDDQLMQEIENILEFSIPQFEKYLADGKKIYDLVEGNLHIAPVGIMPLNPSEGYILLKNGGTKETQVYEYQISIFEQSTEKYRGIYTYYICSYEKTLTNTFENIKSELIRYHKKLPNPATYVIEAEIQLPLEETLLPMAKRSLVKFVAQHGMA